MYRDIADILLMTVRSLPILTGFGLPPTFPSKLRELKDRFQKEKAKEWNRHSAVLSHVRSLSILTKRAGRECLNLHYPYHKREQKHTRSQQCIHPLAILVLVAETCIHVCGHSSTHGHARAFKYIFISLSLSLR